MHLLCNSGQDTLSLAALGAQVTGVDISDEAVAFATRLAADARIDGRFVRSDVYDWLESSPAAAYDLAFSNYGALGWLSDVNQFARGVARILRPGGAFVLMEFHPVLWMFDAQWKHAYPYLGGDVVTDPGVNDYVALSGELLVPWGYEEGERDFVNPHRCHGFCWGVGDVLAALLAAGLRIERFEEYPYANGWRGYERMRELAGRRIVPPEDVPALPLMLGTRAVRDAG